MRLPFGDPSDDDQSPAESEADERIVDDGTIARPTFTPVVREDAGDDAVQDDAVPDAAAETPTVAEPAENYYADSDDADEPDEAPAVVEADEPAVEYEDAEPDEPTPAYDPPAYETPAAFETSEATAEPVTTAPAAASAAPAPVAAADLDQPLLSGEPELLAEWQRVQAGFVDDPQIAVAGAADLVEDACQALIEALGQRQRQMRTMWDHTLPGGPVAAVDTGADTEQLRQVMQRYRALFNQLYQPV